METRIAVYLCMNIVVICWLILSFKAGSSLVSTLVGYNSVSSNTLSMEAKVLGHLQIGSLNAVCS